MTADFAGGSAPSGAALPVTGPVPRAQASRAARLRQFGGFALAIMIFICFGMRVALAVDTTNFNTFIAPVEAEPLFHANNAAVIGYGVNNAGVIVGEVDDSKGRHGFYFRDGAVSEFDCLGATDTAINGINAGNVMVGSCFDATNGWQAFFASPGVFHNFKYPNSTRTLAAAINDYNVIVGSFTNAAGNWGGWWYLNGQFGPLQYPGAASTVVNAINNSNTICGFATGADGHQFGFYRSNNLVYTRFSVSGATDTFCTGVSDDNQLVGYYQSTDGSYHSFVAAPGQFITPIGPANASNTIIQSIMPNGVSLVGQYTSGNATYGFVTGNNAGWPVNPVIFPLAGKSFSGSNVALLPAGNATYAFSFNFYASGNVEFLTQIASTYRESPRCVQDDKYDFTSGSFYVQYSRLYLKGLQGQHTRTDSCNPANQGQAPIAADEYNFEWEVGIAADGRTRLFITDTGDTSPGSSYLDNVLFVKD